MSTEKPNNDELHDRLIDTALREVVGGETPPDLSELILFAASGEKSQRLATLASGTDVLTTQDRKVRRKRNFLIGITLAASLLVVGNMTLPGLQHAKQLEGVAQPEDNTSAGYSQNKLKAVDDGKVNLNATTVLPADTPISNAGQTSSGAAKDFDNSIDLIVETVTEDSWAEGNDGVEPLPTNLDLIISQSQRVQEQDESAQGDRPELDAQGNKQLPAPKRDRFYAREKEQGKDSKLLRMLVTPRIIVEAESEEQLGTIDDPNSGVKLEQRKSRQNWSSEALRPATPAQQGLKVSEFKRTGRRSNELVRWEAETQQLPEIEDRFERKLRRLALDPEQGQGPGTSGDKYTRIYENPFIAAVGAQAVSTFSIDVDTASYANVRQFLRQSGQLPPPDAVRIEELVNYFDYDYTAPTGDTPFAAHVEVAGCPWKADHRLVRVGIKGREIATDNRPQSNLVFLIDVSGSMNEPAKLPLLVEGMQLLTRELGENDRVAIVVYASSEGLALPSTRGDQQDTILAALEKLRAGGSTAGGAGIQLAYKIAQENFLEGGVNRVILATDGDFNVGTTSTAALERLAETNAKETGVFLTVLGFGRGNLNDAMMEAISGKGNGNYHYVDNQTEARKVLVAEMAGTLVTIAKDVKIQIEFNPAQVAAYRLIGYENRMLETQDFNDDKKDAGEIGAGHTVTAIYEVVPAASKLGKRAVDTPAVDPWKYQKQAQPLSYEAANDADASGELLTLKIRYKQPDGEKSTKLEFPITDHGQSFAQATDDFKFASAVASFGMLLRHSEHQGHTSYSAVEEIAQDGAGEDKHGYRAEFLQLVRQANALAGE